MKDGRQLPFVSVVVLFWNGKRFIDPFMKTFLAQTYPQDRMELLFTDNGSHDGSVAYLKKHYGNNKNLNLKIVANDKNYGYAGGNNRGFKQAEGEYVLVCNNDIELDKNAISELVKAAQSHGADATTAKLMYLNKPGIINNAGSMLQTNRDWPIIELGINENDGPKYREDREMTAFCGACVLYKRDFLQTVGLYDEKFFLYFEDGDLAWRGQKAGKKYWLAAKAIAHHFHVGSGGGEGSPVFNFYVGRNRLLILAKNGKFSMFSRALAKTLRDQLLLRIYRLWLAVFRKYPRHLALNEFLASQKMLWSAAGLLPYIWLKRFGVIKEEVL